MILQQKVTVEAKEREHHIREEAEEREHFMREEVERECHMRKEWWREAVRWEEFLLP